MIKLYKVLMLGLLCVAACTEDDALESVILVEQTENMKKPLDDLELKLETVLKLQARVLAIQSELKQVLNPEFEASKMIGREILRSRGVDPDIAFSDPDDPRLMLVPMMADLLDSINMGMQKNGLQIDSVAWVKPACIPIQTNIGNSISIAQDARIGETIFNCAADEGGRVLTVFGTLYTGAAALKVTGKS
jgi:hypothetical protein